MISLKTKYAKEYSPELTAFLQRADVQYASITLRISASSS